MNYSFNLTRNVGRTDGEAPERGWSNINSQATSTREMGPGFRRDTLDDHFNDWNWKKTVGLGMSHLSRNTIQSLIYAPMFTGALLLKKIKSAIPELIERTTDFLEFERNIPPEEIASWKSQVERWENDITNPNPFEQRVKSSLFIKSFYSSI